jgi:hypothetical protein
MIDIYHGAITGYYSIDGGMTWQTALGSSPSFYSQFTEGGVMFTNGTIDVLSMILN